MSFDLNNGAYATVQVTLRPGEYIQAESDAMVSRSANVTLRSNMSGGVMGALGRKFLTGESAFLQELVLDSHATGPGNCMIAPQNTGDINLYRLDASAQNYYPLLIRNGSFLAASSGVKVTSTALLNDQVVVKGLFSGHGLFCLRADGHGDVLFSACGSIHKYELKPGEEFIVDNDHVVAWSENLKYQIRMQSTVWHSTMSGEGLGCFFTGPGTVYVQSHTPKSQEQAVANAKKRPQNKPASCLAMIAVLALMAFIAYLPE